MRVSFYHEIHTEWIPRYIYDAIPARDDATRLI